MKTSICPIRMMYVLGEKVKMKSLLSTVSTRASKHSVPDNTIMCNLYFKRLKTENNLTLFSQQLSFQDISSPKEIFCNTNGFNLDHWMTVNTEYYPTLLNSNLVEET